MRNKNNNLKILLMRIVKCLIFYTYFFKSINFFKKYFGTLDIFAAVCNFLHVTFFFFNYIFFSELTKYVTF